MIKKIETFYKKNIDRPIKKIGIFDSGVGGLSIVKTLQELPIKEIVYIADTANLPYGNKTKKFIHTRCKQLINFLETHDVDCIIVGCHTASAVIFPFLSQEKLSNVPIIDVALPSIYEVLSSQKTKNVGIMGTSMTINTHCHKTMIESGNADYPVYEQACAKLAECIEKNGKNKDKLNMLLEQYLTNFRENNVDTILLGCTHYSFARSEIKDFFNYPITLADGRNFINKIIGKKISNVKNHPLKVSAFVTGNKFDFSKSASSYSNTIFSSIEKIDI